MEAALTYALSLLPLVLFGFVLASKWRWRWPLLVAYVLVYLPFSLAGRYQTANHGGMDWQDHWCPLGLLEKHQPSEIRDGRRYRRRSQVRFTYLGSLFWPLILLDNLVWHPTHESDLSK